MDSSVPTATATTACPRAGVLETTALLALAGLAPLLVHLVPWAGDRPLGAYVLPMFWGAFVAVYFYGARLGLLVGLFAPAINLVVTGLPSARTLALMGLELVVFVGVAAWTVRHRPRLALLAPLGYVVARIATAGLQAAMGDDGVSANGLLHAFVRSSAGLIMLAAINAALVWFYPKPADSER